MRRPTRPTPRSASWFQQQHSLRLHRPSQRGAVLLALILVLVILLSDVRECSGFLCPVRQPSRSVRSIVSKVVWSATASKRSSSSDAESLEREEASSSTNDASPSTAAPATTSAPQPQPKQMGLMWCNDDSCVDDLRERTVGQHNHIVLNGPATGQVAYYWNEPQTATTTTTGGTASTTNDDSDTETPVTTTTAVQCVYIIIKQGADSDALLTLAADAVTNLTHSHENLHILVDGGTYAKLSHYHGVDGDQIHLFEATPCPGYGDRPGSSSSMSTTTSNNSSSASGTAIGMPPLPPLAEVGDDPYTPDLICTLGGDGLLMHAGMLFQGPIPPILCVSGGSLGFLTPFSPSEMVEAIEISLGLISNNNDQPQQQPSEQTTIRDEGIQVFPPNMPGYPYEAASSSSSPLDNANIDNDQPQPHSSKFSFGTGAQICLSIRMRLDCRILTRQGTIKARYNVLNEVVIDRGASPYLAALECFCDDEHLTTVQADGVIFATPTGSTAYSLAAGSSVVHPAVPCILVTPICPHVLSFRSMVFPDHVVLRCYVPDDARSDASVAFDGKHRQELHRGDSVQIQMSAYPVPTINRKDHSADWLSSLKRNFNFNARPRQRPL